jgi:putative transcriptional regulator
MKIVQCRLASLIDAHNLRVSEGGSGERLSQRGLAKKTGVAAATINRLYKNHVRRFDADVIEKICSVLGCEVGDLLILVEPQEVAQ